MKVVLRFYFPLKISNGANKLQKGYIWILKQIRTWKSQSVAPQHKTVRNLTKLFYISGSILVTVA